LPQPGAEPLDVRVPPEERAGRVSQEPVDAGQRRDRRVAGTQPDRDRTQADGVHADEARLEALAPTAAAAAHDERVQPGGRPHPCARRADPPGTARGRAFAARERSDDQHGVEHAVALVPGAQGGGPGERGGARRDHRSPVPERPQRRLEPWRDRARGGEDEQHPCRIAARLKRSLHALQPLAIGSSAAHGINVGQRRPRVVDQNAQV
jgi:hypothetical protein